MLAEQLPDSLPVRAGGDGRGLGGCGMRAGLATVRPSETVLDIGFRHFAVIHRAGEAVAGVAVACGLGGSCC